MDFYSAALQQDDRYLNVLTVEQAGLAAASRPLGNVRAPMGAINFAAGTDPHELAFTISIPEQWKAAGDAYALSATGVPIGVVLGPPDGQMLVLPGDSNLGTFIEPNQTMAYAGLREGGYYGRLDGAAADRAVPRRPQFAQT